MAAPSKNCCRKSLHISNLLIDFMHIWFNRAFSSIYTAIGLLKQADARHQIDNIKITYSSPNPEAPAKLVADFFLQEPSHLKGEEYLAWCLHVCEHHQVDIFWPGNEAKIIVQNQERFAALGTRVVAVAAPEILKLLDNKAQFCDAVDLPSAAPAAFRVFRNIEQFNAAFQELKADFTHLCVKPSKSVYGLGFSLLDEKKSTAQILIAGEQYKIGLEDFKRGLSEMAECRPMLLMEYLDGPEYSVDCVGNNGKVIAAIPRKKSPLPGYAQTIVLDPKILAAVDQLAAQFNLNGIFNVQFKEAAGQPRLLEINARMSGGIGMACQAGVNLPAIYIQGLLHGFDKVYVAPILDGLLVTEVAIPITIHTKMATMVRVPDVFEAIN